MTVSTTTEFRRPRTRMMNCPTANDVAAMRPTSGKEGALKRGVVSPRLSLVAGRRQGIRPGHGEEALYDYETDAREQYDLAASQDARRLRCHVEVIFGRREAPLR